MSKHTLKPWVWEWKKEDDTGWRRGRLIARDIPNGQYNKTIIIVKHYNHTDESQANIDLLETAPERDRLEGICEELFDLLLSLGIKARNCPNCQESTVDIIKKGRVVFAKMTQVALAETEGGATNPKGDTT